MTPNQHAGRTASVAAALPERGGPRPVCEEGPE